LAAPLNGSAFKPGRADFMIPSLKLRLTDSEMTFFIMPFGIALALRLTPPEVMVKAAPAGVARR